MVSGNPPHHSQTNDEPVTIDLEANESEREAAHHVGGEAEASVPPADLSGQPPETPSEPTAGPTFAPEAPAPIARPSGYGTSALVASGIVGGLIALICAGAVQYAGLLPSSPTNSRDTQQLSSLRGEIDGLTQTVAKLGAAPAAKPDTALEARIAALETASKAAAENPTQSTGAGSPDPAAAQKIADLTAQVDQLKASVTQTTQVQASTGADLNKRLDDAEKKLSEPGKDVAVAQAIAAAGLKAAIDRGGPFRPELDTFAGVAPNDEAVAALRSFADTGVPSRSELIKQVPDVVTSVLSATKQSDDSQSWSDRLMTSAMSLVTVRPVGDVPGDSVDAIAARFENKIRNGDLPGAVTEWNSLPDTAKSASAAFKQSIEARIHVEDLVGDTLSKAIAGAGKQN